MGLAGGRSVPAEATEYVRVLRGAPGLELGVRLGAAPAAVDAKKDIVYATVDGKDLRLDLYLPSGVSRPPLLVWVHGGAWRSGTKASVPMVFVENGFATASLDFRQSTDARFPANVHDIKAAIRFLRAKSADTDTAAIASPSAALHPAVILRPWWASATVTRSWNIHGHGKPRRSRKLSMLTKTNYSLLRGLRELHVVGSWNQSSDVAAIVSYYGASNLTTILAQSTPHGLVSAGPRSSCCWAPCRTPPRVWPSSRARCSTLMVAIRRCS